MAYRNTENGFCVLRARARGHRDVVTVVGHAAAISAGEWIMASGQWVNDRTHGQQFKARFLRTSAPTSADGIEKYLSSGMIRGVGRSTPRTSCVHSARRFSTSSRPLRIVCARSMVLGQFVRPSILAAWAEQKAVREIMVFLHSHGVSTAPAIQVMTDNPNRFSAARTKLQERSAKRRGRSDARQKDRRGLQIGKN